MNNRVLYSLLLKMNYHSLWFAGNLLHTERNIEQTAAKVVTWIVDCLFTFHLPNICKQIHLILPWAETGRKECYLITAVCHPR